MDQFISSISFNLIVRCLFAGVFFTMSYFVANDGWGAVSFITPASNSGSEQPSSNWPWEKAESKKEATVDWLNVWLHMSLFAGISIYGIHRSLIYPVIEHLLDRLISKEEPKPQKERKWGMLFFGIVIGIAGVCGIAAAIVIFASPASTIMPYAGCVLIIVLPISVIIAICFRKKLISDATQGRIEKLWRRGARTKEDEPINLEPEDSTVTQKKSQPYYGRHIAVWADFAHQQYTSTWCLMVGAFLGTEDLSKAHPEPRLIAIGLIMFSAALVSDWRLHSIIENVYSDKPKNLNI